MENVGKRVFAASVFFYAMNVRKTLVIFFDLGKSLLAFCVKSCIIKLYNCGMTMVTKEIKLLWGWYYV